MYIIRKYCYVGVVVFFLLNALLTTLQGKAEGWHKSHVFNMGVVVIVSDRVLCER